MKIFQKRKELKFREKNNRNVRMETLTRTRIFLTRHAFIIQLGSLYTQIKRALDSKRYRLRNLLAKQIRLEVFACPCNRVCTIFQGLIGVTVAKQPPMLNHSVFFRRERGCFHLPSSFHSYVYVRLTILFPSTIASIVFTINFFSSFELEGILSYSFRNIYFVLR